MLVDRAKLARRIGLPENSTEAVIRGRLAGLEAASSTRTVRALAPTRRRIDAAIVRAATDTELRQLGSVAVTPAERELIDEEASVRQLMASAFPAVGRKFSSPRARIQRFD